MKTESFVHKAHGWNLELSSPDAVTGKAVLKVTSQKYDQDPCAGQNLVVSAFFKACELLGVDKAGDMTHSGGFVQCEVLPEAESDSE